MSKWQYGFTKATETPRALNLTPLKDGKIHSDVFFSSILFLAQALHLKNYDLAVGARATRILTEKGRVYGVEVMDQEKNAYVLRAKNIVLSASTFETPRLLLHSRIQGKAIGHYLIDHAALKVSAVVGFQDLPQVSGPLHILVPPTRELPYQFLIAKVGDIPDGNAEIIMRGYGTVEPRFENKVELDPERVDEFGVPKLNVQYSYTPRDEETIRKTANTMEQVLTALGVTKITEDICLRPPGDDHHESGTCRMGDDPATSATNRFGQIHGYPGLFVADNSILPSLGVANPTLTTVALAIRTADYIASKEGGI
jgi:choline dehydrogenase-like flavoprotein